MTSIICLPTLADPVIETLKISGGAFVAAYIIGSIPFGLILTKAFLRKDIRTIGSGNIGSTNVLRTGNKILAFFTLALDSTKGIAALFLMIYLQKSYGFQIPLKYDFNYCETNKIYCDICKSPPIYHYLIPMVTMLTGFFAILGHCFPIWLKFKGGKGVATALGALLAAVPYAGLAACATWLITAKITKISSLSALVAVAVAPIVTLIIYGTAPAMICALITLLVWIRHKDNIKRLLKGEEPKIGSGKKKDEPVSKQD